MVTTRGTNIYVYKSFDFDFVNKFKILFIKRQTFQNKVHFRKPYVIGTSCLSARMALSLMCGPDGKFCCGEGIRDQMVMSWIDFQVEIL